jgi:polyhydroxybutyrate depolymerase
MRYLQPLLFAALSLISTASVCATTEQTVVADGVVRRFLVHVPNSLAQPNGSNQAVPLLFAFHGGNGDGKGMQGLTGFNAIAEREAFIVIYPDGLGKGWNDGRSTRVSTAHRDKVNDLAFFDAMLEQVSKLHKIDAQRIYATGISNGAIFSHYLAANRADKIAAIAPVVGGIADPFHQQFNPSEPVAVAVFQGTDDELVPYKGGKIVGRGFQDRGSVISTDAAVALWRKANGCHDRFDKQQLPDRDTGDGTRVESTHWRGCNKGATVSLFRIDGGGHTWPGGPQYAPQSMIGRVSKDIDSQTVWNALKTHQKTANR